MNQILWMSPFYIQVRLDSNNMGVNKQQGIQGWSQGHLHKSVGVLFILITWVSTNSEGFKDGVKDTYIKVWVSYLLQSALSFNEIGHPQNESDFMDVPFLLFIF